MNTKVNLRLMSIFSGLAALVFLVAVAGTPAHAITFDGSGVGAPADGTGTVTDGDKLFSAFTCQIIEDDAVNNPADCTGITINPLPGGFGITFDNVFDATSVANALGASLDFQITYTATCTNIDCMIDAIELFVQTGITGDAFINVTETVSGIGGDVTVSCVLSVSGSCTEMLDLAGWFTEVTVAKDIRLVALGTDDDASFTGFSQVTISFLDQEFFQTTMVPEPATLGLFGVGLLALGFATRRRRSKTSHRRM